MAGLLLVALALAYAWRLGVWARGFARAARETDALAAPPDAALPSVTVVVPARDEEDTIGPCVDSVLAVDYPRDKLEVIVVDDDSSDRTAAVVRERMALAPALAVAGGELPEDQWAESEGAGRLRLVQIPENRRRDRAHKKRAIEKAIEHARGEIILTTDADCVVPRGWARALAAQFEGPEVAFVSGPVAYRLAPGDGLFERVQALDFFGVMACGAGAIGAEQPHLANGANVGYRRETFVALGGFSGIDHVTSGDDELLMQKIAYGTPLDVRFCADPGAVVLTDPVRNVRAFVHQRKRWASKGAHYPWRLQRMLLALVAFFAALTASFLALVVVPSFWPWVAAALAVKAAAELAVLVPAARRFGQRGLLPAYPLHLVLHAPHSLLVAVLGPLGGFEWKGRAVPQ
ncbi:glycosyltransferase [Rubrivirga sp. S365]|uniref:glycosyltransferase n=1 Tax=Rubrivirga sp. S365 TaxID=3076080 RepID=UPI0028CAFE4A|nr:glycosyltransferase [Rubrivirga sp. S365]MDT7857521.1 glycosyltransferase [Rubrivirga sp. S365]